MDKAVRYQKAILSFLNDYARVKPVGFENVDNQLVIDDDNHRYLLQRIGWSGDEYIHYTVFQFDILKGKVWVRQNRTDLPLEDELVELGIAKEDLVWSFLQPEWNKKEMAVAA